MIIEGKGGGKGILLRELVVGALEEEIKLRYWYQPARPIGLRNGEWKQLCDEGVDLINAGNSSLS